MPAGGANGVLATHGGRFAGLGFYLRDGRPVFTWNLLDMERVKWEAPQALPPGRHTVAFEFEPDPSGPPVGRGGGERFHERRHPAAFAADPSRAQRLQRRIRTDLGQLGAE